MQTAYRCPDCRLGPEEISDCLSNSLATTPLCGRSTRARSCFRSSPLHTHRLSIRAGPMSKPAPDIIHGRRGYHEQPAFVRKSRELYQLSPMWWFHTQPEANGKQPPPSSLKRTKKGRGKWGLPRLHHNRNRHHPATPFNSPAGPIDLTDSDLDSAVRLPPPAVVNMRPKVGYVQYMLQRQNTTDSSAKQPPTAASGSTASGIDFRVLLPDGAVVQRSSS